MNIKEVYARDGEGFPLIYTAVIDGEPCFCVEVENYGTLKVTLTLTHPPKGVKSALRAIYTGTPMVHIHGENTSLRGRISPADIPLEWRLDFEER